MRLLLISCCDNKFFYIYRIQKQHCHCYKPQVYTAMCSREIYRFTMSNVDGHTIYMHIGCLNCPEWPLSPTKSYLNGWYWVFQGSLYRLNGSWRHRTTPTVKAGFSVKVKVAVKVSCLVLHEQETEQRLTVVDFKRLLHVVSRSLILDLVAREYITHGWQQQVSHSALAS